MLNVSIRAPIYLPVFASSYSIITDFTHEHSTSGQHLAPKDTVLRPSTPPTQKACIKLQFTKLILTHAC